MTAATPAPHRREYLGTLLLLAAGGVLGLVAAGQSWGSASVPTSFTATSVTVTGRDLDPLASAVPLVALAAVILVPAVRGVGRRVAGAVLVALATAMCVTSVIVVADLAGRVQTWITSAPDHSGGVQEVSTAPGWAMASVVAAVLVVGGGVLVAWRGPRWPGMSRRYQRPARPTTPVSTQAPRDPARRPADTWDALDRGDDPTV